jgi:hypothetical protein
VDVEARSIVLPFVCKWCQEGFHGYEYLKVAPPESAGPFIVEFTAPVFKGEWMRSGNRKTKGVFSTKAEARLAIATETDGFEYRVVPAPVPKPITNQESIPALDEQFELDSVLIADLEKQLAEANRNTECWKDHYTALWEILLAPTLSADIEAKDSEAKSASLDQRLRESEASVQYWRTEYTLEYARFQKLERAYLAERNKTWLQKLFS